MTYALVSVLPILWWFQSPPSCVPVQRRTNVRALCSTLVNQLRWGCLGWLGCLPSPRTPSSPLLLELLILVSPFAFFFVTLFMSLAYCISCSVYNCGFFLAILIIFFAAFLSFIEVFILPQVCDFDNKKILEKIFQDL